MLINQAIALQIQFNEDGTYQAWAPKKSFKGKWAIVDEDHLATWSHDNKPRKVSRFRITGKNLVITDSEGIHHVHQRDIHFDLERNSANK